MQDGASLLKKPVPSLVSVATATWDLTSIAAITVNIHFCSTCGQTLVNVGWASRQMSSLCLTHPSTVGKQLAAASSSAEVPMV